MIANRWSLSDEDVAECIQKLLVWIGEDPQREGLRETPWRFIRAWKEWASG